MRKPPVVQGRCAAQCVRCMASPYTWSYATWQSEDRLGEVVADKVERSRFRKSVRKDARCQGRAHPPGCRPAPAPSASRTFPPGSAPWPSKCLPPGEMERAERAHDPGGVCPLEAEEGALGDDGRQDAAPGYPRLAAGTAGRRESRFALFMSQRRSMGIHAKEEPSLQEIRGGAPRGRSSLPCTNAAPRKVEARARRKQSMDALTKLRSMPGATDPGAHAQLRRRPSFKASDRETDGGAADASAELRPEHPRVPDEPTAKRAIRPTAEAGVPPVNLRTAEACARRQGSLGDSSPRTGNDWALDWEKLECEMYVRVCAGLRRAMWAEWSAAVYIRGRR